MIYKKYTNYPIHKLLVCTFLAIYFFNSQANCLAPTQVKRGELKLHLNANYFKTSENYQATGDEFDDLGPGANYSTFNYKTSARYGITSTLGFHLGLGFAMATSESEKFNRSNTALTNLDGGLFYRWRWKRLVVTPFLDAALALAPIDPNTDEVITNDGVSSLGGGFSALTQLWNVYPYFSVKQILNTDGRANALSFKAGAYQKFQDLRVGIDVISIEATSEDEFTTTPSKRTDVTDRVNAGSLRYYAINPSLLSVSPWMAFQIDSLGRLQLTYHKTINGKNSAAGWGISIGLVLVLRSTAETFRSEPENSEVSDFKQYQIESQQYDESLFNNVEESTKQREEKDVLDEAQQRLEQ